MNKNKLPWTKSVERYRFFLLLIMLSIIPLFDFFHPGLPITHDGQDHVARIANFYQNLQEGTIIPRWAGNLNWGYGHPILMFLYPLPSYMVSLFHFFGLSLVDSTKLVFIVAFFLSGLTMYLWVSSFLGEKAGFVAGLLYLFAPYRFVDLYVRGAIGEHVAFIFPPLILFFLLQLSKKLTIYRIIGGSLAIAGLILSHNAITLMFLPIIFLYTTYLFWQLKARKYFLLSSICLIFFGFTLSAFFWLPAFFEGKYTLRDIVTAGEYAQRFVLFKDLVYGSWNYGGTGLFSVQVGFVHWLMILAVLPVGIILKKKKQALYHISFFTFILFWLTVFLMTSFSQPVWELITTLQKFQFPWRLLSVVVFLTSLAGGLCLTVFSKKFQTLIVILILVLAAITYKNYWYANGFLTKPEGFYTSIYNSTTDTGESSPIWSVRFMLERPANSIEVIEGEAQVIKLMRTTTRHTYEIIAKAQARIRENTLYFPGWNVFVDGKPVPIEFQDPANRGLITFFVDPGKHQVEVEFKETKFRLFSNIISGISFFILLGFSVIPIWLRFR